MELRAESVYKNILRNDPSMTILLPSIALLIAAVFGAPATTAFAADDPFKNKVSIEIDEDNKILATNQIMEITTPAV